jgi:hypothetical protein
MAEETTQETPQEQTTTAELDPKTQESTPPEQNAENPVEKAKAILANLKTENDRMEKNIKAMQKMQADFLLSGRAPAGAPVTEETQMRANVSKLLEGTGLDPFAK